MTTAIDTTKSNASAIEQLLVQGDLKPLSAEQRVAYYNRVCESLSLNPLTRPFEYITLNGRLVLYAKKDATEQLRANHGVSITGLDSRTIDGVHLVIATARDAKGRTDVATGAVSVAGLRGDALANAVMKAETKAKRRVTLSICGLGMLDETETETINHPDPQVTTDMPKQIAAPTTQTQQQRLRDDLKAAIARLKACGKYSDGGYRELLANFGVERTNQLNNDQLKELIASIEDACAEAADEAMAGSSE